LLFPEVARRVKDRYAGEYVAHNFAEVMSPMFEQLKPGTLRKPGASHKDLYATLAKALRADFTI
jgi:hypothetical protein